METLDDRRTTGTTFRPQPGVLIVFCAGFPSFKWLPLDERGVLRLGRGSHPGLELDARLSREHAEIAFDGAEWTVRDLGSRNGTSLDGVALHGERVTAEPRAVRLAQTIVLPMRDGTSALVAEPMRQGDHGEPVIGMALRRALAEVEVAACAMRSALVLGESGSGKELAAKTFHAEGPNRKGPLVAVNCATIPHGLAERLLFGAKRGAFSGATADAEGYIQAADRGVLFLDEVGELEPEVQAKLLRVIETREVAPLGSTHAQKVDVRFCFATHRDLRAAVGQGRFRSDLYYRIAQPEIRLPPLRDRLEEIPWHVMAEVRAIDAHLAVSAELIEACLLRPWPGNVRELRAEARRLASTAAAGAPRRTLRAEHLAEDAGTPLVRSSPPPLAMTASAPPNEDAAIARRAPITRERVEATLREHPTASAVASALGVHRSHLYRLLKQHGIERPRDA